MQLFSALENLMQRISFVATLTSNRYRRLGWPCCTTGPRSTSYRAGAGSAPAFDFTAVKLFRGAGRLSLADGRCGLARSCRRLAGRCRRVSGYRGRCSCNCGGRVASFGAVSTDATIPFISFLCDHFSSRCLRSCDARRMRRYAVSTCHDHG
jgi:hypothetical protein